MGFRGTPWSKGHYYRRLRQAAALGVSVHDIPDMRGRHQNHARGARNGRWNGGRMRTSHGYMAVKVSPDHHLRMAHGYAYEHQLVAESLLGRRLRSDEVIHHLDGDRSNNTATNLSIQTRSGHASLHARASGIRDARGRFVAGRKRHCDPSEWPEDLRVREWPA